MSAVEYDELKEWAVPEMGVEFADTLSRIWVEKRADLLPLMPPAADVIVKGLESLASVTIGAEVIAPLPSER